MCFLAAGECVDGCVLRLEMFGQKQVRCKSSARLERGEYCFLVARRLGLVV